MDRRSFLLSSAAVPGFSLLGNVSDPHAGLPKAPPTDPDEKYWKELRWHFSTPRGETYCNTATLGSSPKSVVNAIADHMRYVETNLVASWYRGDNPHFLAGYQDEPTLRKRIGKLMNCSMQEVALTRNATMGMNYVAQGLDLQKGDEVIMTDQEHSGGRCGYDVRVKRDGIKIIQVTTPLPANDPDEIVQRFADAVTERTKVVAFPHISSGLAIVYPAKKIIAAIRKKNPDVYAVVDGAQSLGHIPVDVQDIDCDAYFASPHKWLLAPKGTGVLYVRKKTNERVWTTQANGDWDFREDVGRRFTHIGTGNQSLHKGFEAALDFLERIGMDVIHARLRQLGDHLREGLAKIDGVKITSPTHKEMCCGTVCYEIAGIRNTDFVKTLWKEDKIMPRPVNKGVRQSSHIYVTLDAIDRTLARIKKLTAKSGG